MEAFKKRVFGDLAKTEWYLQRVGIHPDWQGKGIGTALIEHGRQKQRERISTD
ncbi:hypothetical protein C0991_005477 [Blastosporella zonata]|nr:hypothetical protein C0991_005477 [Blastosporella zonata]